MSILMDPVTLDLWLWFKISYTTENDLNSALQP